jgi:hypothetical protein
MLKKHNVRGRDDGELHREHLTTGGHPGSRDDLVPERGDVLDGLIIHQVCGAFDLDDGLVCADGVMAVLEVEAECKMGSVLEKDVANGAVNDVIDKWGLNKVWAVSFSDGVNMYEYRLRARCSPPREKEDRCNGRGRRGQSWRG